MRDAPVTALDGIAVLLTALLAAVLVAFPFVVAPHYEAMFRDFGASPLPPLTRLVLSARIPIGLGATTATSAVLGCVPAIPRGVRRGVIVGAFVIGCAGIAVCLVGLYLPIFRLADSIQE
jgi:hypothetical protein